MKWDEVGTFTTLTGRTVQSIERVPARFGFTFDSWLLFVCTDGTRAMIPIPVFGRSNWSVASDHAFPDSEAMKKAPLFFTPQEIAAKVEKEETVKRGREASSRAEKQRQIERLQRELEKSA